MKEGAEILQPGNTELCECYNEDLSQVGQVRRKMPSGAALEASLELLAAASEPVRARILCAIAETELCVCELAELLEMSIPAVSHHLRVLREGGFIQGRKRGRFVFYSPTRGHAQGMVVELLRKLARQEEARLRQAEKQPLGGVPQPAEG